MADEQAQETQAATETEANAGENQESFEAFLLTQPEGVKKLYESHVHGLKSGLEKERANGAQKTELEKKLAAYEKADAAKKKAEMSAAELAQSELKDAQEKYQAIEAEALGYRREKSFLSAVNALQVEFASEQAQGDALSFIPPETDFSDAQAVKVALAEIQKARSYLFAQKQAAKDSADAAKRGGGKSGELTKERKQEVSSFLPSRLRR